MNEWLKNDKPLAGQMGDGYDLAPRFLIWSYEHDMWWKSNRCGYTRHRGEAGRYSKEEADEICSDANCHIRPGEPLDEIAVAESDFAGPPPAAPGRADD